MNIDIAKNVRYFQNTIYNIDEVKIERMENKNEINIDLRQQNMKLHFFLPLLIFITVLLEMSQYLHLKKNELINDKSINIHIR